MRAAAVDIGTNSVLLLVAERTPEGVKALVERATITRLGEGVDRTRRLASEAVARTNACLSDYARELSALGVDRIDVVGTSAMRDAEGSDAVRDHVRRELGVDARVISGDEEARLTFGGALSGLRNSEGAVVVFDIGGGSTEVVRGTIDAEGRPWTVEFARSFDVGSVRLTERHVRSDPPTAPELDAVRADARRAFAAIPEGTWSGTPDPSTWPVGIAGTVTTLAAVALGLADYDSSRVHGCVLPRADLRRVVERLATLPLAERRSLPGLQPKRADVIVAGALVADAFLEHLGAGGVRISDRGVRWGLVLDALA